MTLKAIHYIQQDMRHMPVKNLTVPKATLVRDSTIFGTAVSICNWFLFLSNNYAHLTQFVWRLWIIASDFLFLVSKKNGYLIQILMHLHCRICFTVPWSHAKQIRLQRAVCYVCTNTTVVKVVLKQLYLNNVDVQ